MNNTANKIVKNPPINADSRVPSIRAWWAYVIVAPLDNNKIVLSNGMAKGFNGSIPLGGQDLPNSTVGDNDEWKSLY